MPAVAIDNMTNFTSILPFLTFLPLLFLFRLVDVAEGSPKDLVILWKDTDGRCEFTIDAGPDWMDVFEVRRFFLYNKRAIFVAGKEPEELWYLKDWEAQKCTSGTDPQDIEAPIPASYQIEHVSIHQHQQPIMDQVQTNNLLTIHISLINLYCNQGMQYYH